MKKFLLTTASVLTILFAQAQIQCQSNFSYMQNGPTTVFADLSTITPGWSTNYSVSWLWDFGDNSAPSYLQNPTHTYSNGIYSPCLTVTFFDSVMMNSCISVYCDSILIGNGPTASWDCAPATGCYDPGTGLGQYSTLSACQSACTVTSSWDCNPPNMPAGCYDPGTGNGQYTTLSACQAVCGTPPPSWDCSTSGCYDPGTGIGQYTTLSACQAVCVSTVSNFCDSMTSSGSQTQIIMQVNNINSIIDYWITTAPNGTVLGEDSLWNIHNVFNYNPMGLPYDTITTCISYADANGYSTCCVTWIWDANSGVWAKMGSVTSIGEIGSFDKNLLKVVDLLGRETSVNSNQTLFFIYEDGTIEKRYIIDRN